MHRTVIPFNKSYSTGKEFAYIQDTIDRGHIAGNGFYTKKCQSFLQEKYNFPRCFLTTSCTDALEMAAILLNICPGDEVIMPAYTFVSTANAFVLRGAKIVFCDSRQDHPSLDEELLESLITPQTKAIVPVHYAGVACDMDRIMALADKYQLFVVEDAAQAVDSFYKGKPLGRIGHLGCFSFHETKNISSGEGGMLVVNDERFMARAEIIWEKGTNRVAFYRGEIDKYGWVDIGSSFLPAEPIAAYLWAQLESLDKIQTRRLYLWKSYYDALAPLCQELGIRVPFIPEYASNNAHMFYLVCKSLKQRDALIAVLKQGNVMAIFHYLALNKSAYYLQHGSKVAMPQAELYADCLLRLPMFYDLPEGIPNLVAKLMRVGYKQLNC